MKIEPRNIKIKEIVNGYKDNNEDGVFGYGGKLNIRPAFQREFVYNIKERNAVIKTVLDGFPLNTMYWSVNGDGTYELMDGQQRTISICQYVYDNIIVELKNGSFGFENLTKDQKERFENYELYVYICEGTESDKLDWFRTINIAGEKLTEQELLNAMHTGTWLTDAKKWFSKTGCPAYQKGKDYISGSPIKQDYLEKALDWITVGQKSDDKRLENYMNLHQHDKDAQELWQHFQTVIDWIERLFPKSNYRSIMKGLEWGKFYNKYKDKTYNANDLENTIAELILDDEVTNKRGIYEYLLSGDKNTLSLRNFTESIKRKKYAEIAGVCSICKEFFDYEEMEADHIIPWSEGGKTDIENCQMLCRNCNRKKSNK